MRIRFRTVKFSSPALTTVFIREKIEVVTAPITTNSFIPGTFTSLMKEENEFLFFVILILNKKNQRITKYMKDFFL